MMSEERARQIAYEWGDDDYCIEDVVNAIKQALKEERESEIANVKAQS